MCEGHGAFFFVQKKKKEEEEEEDSNGKKRVLFRRLLDFCRFYLYSGVIGQTHNCICREFQTIQQLSGNIPFYIQLTFFGNGVSDRTFRYLGARGLKQYTYAH